MNGKPLEIEYKYLIEYPDTVFLATLPRYEMQEILQIYTRLPTGRKCRIRKSVQNGTVKYEKTFKQDVTAKTRVEIEEEITKEEFDALSLLRISDRLPIEKVRHSFSLEGFVYEVDVFPFWNDRAFLEIEVESEDIEPPIPDFIHVIKDVTEDKRYRNSALSRQIIFEEI